MAEDYDGAVNFFEAIVQYPNNEGNWGWPDLQRACAAKGGLAGAIQKFERAVDESQVDLFVCSLCAGTSPRGRLQIGVTLRSALRDEM
jgi:hypothetical protein